MGNTLGKNFKITSFGESHGKCVGIVIDGCPSGLPLTEKDIQSELDKRKRIGKSRPLKGPKKTRWTFSPAFSRDKRPAPPLCMVVWNKDNDSEVYEKTKDLLRPGHADYTAFMKYGGFNDYRGGGRFPAGSPPFCQWRDGRPKLLNLTGMEILAYTGGNRWHPGRAG